MLLSGLLTRYIGDKMAKAGRPRLKVIKPEQYKETIIRMMRYGTNVDQIAKDLDIKESVLDDFIRKEGIDWDLRRRSWAWKTKGKVYRKRRGGKHKEI